MDGIRVGKRVIGAQAPVTVGWENIPKVEGGPVKQFIFTWFQPTMLFALIAVLVLRAQFHRQGIDRHRHRHRLQGAAAGARMGKPALRELAPDLEGTGHRPVLCRARLYAAPPDRRYIGDGAMIEAIQHSFDWDKFAWFIGLPLLLQAFLISFTFDFGQYWMHRGDAQLVSAVAAPLGRIITSPS
jgi:hypothetical protein